MQKKGDKEYMYGRLFFKQMRQHIQLKPSAQNVLPVVKKYRDFKSVVDVGCGVGGWVKACLEMGITDVLGIDGNARSRDLVIPTEYFVHGDVTERALSRNKVGRTFDLALSLEVAEHLKESYLSYYLDNLVHLSNYILFSAAIPGQGGVGHINEQWPSYWLIKFAAYDYIGFDCIRREIWNNDCIGWPYRQNVIFFVSKHVIDQPDNLRLRQMYEDYEMHKPLDVAHPKYYLRHAFLLPKETKKTFILKKIWRGIKMLFGIR